MIARTAGLLVLVAAAGLATPWLMSEPVTGGTTVAAVLPTAPTAMPDPHAQLRAAVRTAAQEKVPGARGSGWVLHRLHRSEPGIDGRERIRATGVISWPGTPDTAVQLSGRFDPATGELARVTYTLEAPGPEVAEAPTAPAWSVELAVRQALAQQLPGQDVGFALDSAQSIRLPDGGRRFEGFGIGTWGSGDARFVAFTLVLSPDGQARAFDYGDQSTGADASLVASY